MADSEDDRTTSATTVAERLPRATVQMVTAGADPERSEAGTAVEPGRFVVGEEIGRGGMGRVFAARDQHLDRTVAIKEMLTDSERARRRFEREVRITARLQHPSILPLYDAGTWQSGRPYYVMRLVSGQPLSDEIAARKSLDDRLALLPQFLAATDAVAFAHREHIIHRDLKPENILVGAHGETVVIDWGIAKDLHKPAGDADDLDEPAQSVPHTVAGSVIGTPGYMAPEQAAGDPTDGRSDVYALGACLYELLSGEPPYGSGDATSILHRQVAEPAPSLAHRVAGVPPDLVAIVQTALAAQPEDRYADAGALAADLRRFQTGRFVAAHHYTWRERVSRFVRRRKAVIAVAAVAIAVIVAVVIGAVVRIAEQRDLAVQARNETAERADLLQRSRAQEAERADELLLSRAQRLLETDPTAAVAVLKRLPSESRHWTKARSIFVEARLRGVATRVRGHRHWAGLEWHPSEPLLMSAGDETVLIHDFSGDQPTTRELLTTTSRLVSVVFSRDGRLLIVATESGGVETVELSTGARVALSPDATIIDLKSAGDSVVWRSADGSIVRSDLATRQNTVLGAAQPDRSASIAVSPDHRVVVSYGFKEPPILWADGKKRELAPAGYGVVIRPDSGALAFVDFGKGVYEMSIDGPAPQRLGHWPEPASPWIEYASDGTLYATGFQGKVVTLGADGVKELGESPHSSFLVRTPNAIIVSGSNALHPIGSAIRTVPVPLGSEGLRRATAGHGQVAYAGGGEFVLVWNLAQIMPRDYGPSDVQKARFLSSEAMIVAAKDGALARLDLATGVRTPLAQLDMPRLDLLVSPSADLLVASSAATHICLRLSDGAVAERIHATTLATIGPGRVAYVNNRVLFQARPFDAAAPKRLTELDSDPLGIAMFDDMMVVTTDGGMVYINPGSAGERTVQLPVRPLTAPAFDRLGRLYVGSGSQVHRWTGDEFVQVTTLPVDRYGLFALADVGLLALAQRELFFISEDEPTRPMTLPTANGGMVFDRYGMAMGPVQTGLAFVDVGAGRSWVIEAEGALISDRAVATSGQFSVVQDGRLSVYDLRAPTAPDEIRSALRRATNATVADDYTSLRWP